MINRIFFIGNLGRDPELRTLENGTAVARLSLATNESYKDKEDKWQKVTQWHDIIMWRDLAIRAEKQLKKGDMIYLEGKLTHRKYTDKDGNDRYITEVVANTFRSLEKREKEDTFPTEEQPTSRDQGPTAPPPPPSDTDDNLPF